MAINLNELEASGKRWEPPSEDFPMGKFIDGSAAGKRDGSYCKAAWANNIFGFFGALLHNAEMTPDGQVDTARKSQLYTALVKIIDTLVSKAGVRYDKAQGLKDGEKSVARENINAADATTTATELGKKLNSSEFTTACKNLITKWGGTIPA